MKKLMFLPLTIFDLFLLVQNSYSQKIVKVEVVQLGANHIFPGDF